MYSPPAEAESLIATLREELQQHGALLRLLEIQQKAPVACATGQAPELAAEIEENFSALRLLRQRRQSELSVFTQGGHPQTPTDSSIHLQSLLPHFPEVIAPLICGLVEEVNELIGRVNRLTADSFRAPAGLGASPVGALSR